MNRYRSFVFYGALFGQVGVKGYLDEVASWLGQYGLATTHYSTDNAPIGAANSQALPVIVWGFSLGANQCGYVSQYINRPIVALVAMDPSKQSPLCLSRWQNVGPRVKAGLCFYNPGAWVYGGCKLVGKTVKTEQINKYHLGVPFDRTLIAKGMAFTKKAIADFEKPDAVV